MVEVRNLTKKYGSHIAVDDISFTLTPGKVYGLLGPNGAGKSTTMNMMTGYLAPSNGEIRIAGHDIYKQAKAAKRQIGYLPENPPVYPDMSVHEYLMFTAELKGVRKSDRFLRVEEVMEETGITDVADKLIRALSKGYRQRVGFAGAVLGDPQVIILDEPTVGLDPKQIIEFRTLIRSLGEDHIVLISSHILSEISAVCDHVFIINNGKLVVDDAVENLDQYVEDKAKLHITMKGDANVARNTIEQLSGVVSVSVEAPESAAEGTKLLVVELESDDETLKEQVSLALMEQKILILGLREEKGSLEQIFLEITQEDEATPLTADMEADEEEADDIPESSESGNPQEREEKKS